VHLRHAEFWMDFAERAARGFESAEWRRWVTRAHDAMSDLRAALAWTIANGHTDVGLRTAAALRGFWEFTSQHQEAFQWLTSALAADDGRADVSARAAALWARSMFPSVSLEQAERDAAEALELYTGLGDRSGMALCRAAASAVDVYRGAYRTAMAVAAEAVELAESSADVTAMTWARWFNVLAAEDFDATQAPLASALALARQTGASWRVGRLLQLVGFAAMDDERYAAARMLHAEALPSAQLAEDHTCVADILGNEAIAALLDGDVSAAAEAAMEQFSVVRRRRVTWMSYGLLTAAALAARRDLAEDSATLCGGAQALLDARTIYHAELSLLRRVQDRDIERLRREQPLRWTLAVERGRGMGLDALIDLALDICADAQSSVFSSQ
jgi:hypothetical protein